MKCLNYLLPVMLLLPAFAVQSCDDDDDNFSKKPSQRRCYTENQSR